MQTALGRFALYAALLVMLLPAGAAAGEPVEVPGRHLELVRMTQGPASFEIALNVAPPPGSHSVDAFVGAFALRTDTQGEVQQVIGLGGSPVGGDRSVGVFINGTEVSLCSVAGVCGLSPTLAYQKFIALEDSGGPDALNRLFIVVEGDVRLDIDFESDGWVLADTSLGYRYVDFRTSEGAAVVTPVRSADLFQYAELEGGELGSIAQAIPPCSTSISGVVSRGVGTMTLSGGEEPSSLRCPSVAGDEPPDLEDRARQATTWVAEGDVVGDNTLREGRLFVIDLPSCSFLIPGIPGEAEDHECVDA